MRGTQDGRNISLHYLLTLSSCTALQTVSKPMMNHLNTKDDRLRRKSLALERVLKDAETGIESLNDHVEKLVADYEQHHTFLRSVAHKALKTNVPIQRNSERLERKNVALKLSFDKVIEMIQLARVKAASSGLDIEKVLMENERLKKRVEELESGVWEDPRKKAEDRWLVCERESAQSSSLV
jgi:hypothetical protein